MKKEDFMFIDPESVAVIAIEKSTGKAYIQPLEKDNGFKKLSSRGGCAVPCNEGHGECPEIEGMIAECIENCCFYRIG